MLGRGNQSSAGGLSGGGESEKVVERRIFFSLATSPTSAIYKEQFFACKISQNIPLSRANSKTGH